MITCFRLPLIAILLLAAIVPAGCQKNTTPTESSSASNAEVQLDGKLILEHGQAEGQMPKGLKIRIGACMGEAEDGTPAVSRELIELWEFTPGEVHKVEHRSEDGKANYHRIESRKFDTSSICKDLIEGRAFEIQSRKGSGPDTVLAGTIYHRGSRSLEVFWNDQSILQLDETNGPTFVAFKQTDAEAFGKLYDRLAMQARTAFK